MQYRSKIPLVGAGRLVVLALILGAAIYPMPAQDSAAQPGANLDVGPDHPAARMKIVPAQVNPPPQPISTRALMAQKVTA